ncbi:hypothetical protein [Dictyobacter halimunensis]
MMKKTFLHLLMAISCTGILLLTAACTPTSDTSIVEQPAKTPTATATPIVITPTAITTPTAIMPTATATPIGPQSAFAATVGSSGNPVNRTAEGNNLTTIHSPVDRPVANFTRTLLNVPPQAKGVVYIQNDSANPMTLVSDTPMGFEPFTIAHDSTIDLVFHRTGTFKAHLKDYPISADTTITIIITAPSPD